MKEKSNSKMTPQFCVICLLMLFFIFCNIADGYDRTLRKRICNGDLYSRHVSIVDSYGEYECAVNALFEKIQQDTPAIRDYQLYYSMGCYTRTTYVYGRSSCQKTLSPDECSSCMKQAHDELFKECTHSIGAQVELANCRIRYENYPFND